MTKKRVAKNKQQTAAQNKMWLWLLLVAMVLLAGGAMVLIGRAGQRAEQGEQVNQQEAEAAPAENFVAPEISLNTIDGEPINLSDYRGKPVLVNFWATWCPPCRAEMPDFQAVQREQGDEVVILAVNATGQDDVEKIPAFVQEMGLTFPILLDEKSEVGRTYNVLGLPTTVFINADGTINEIYTGAVNKAYIESKLAEMQ